MPAEHIFQEVEIKELIDWLIDWLNDQLFSDGN